MFLATGSQHPIEGAIGWIADALLGEVAITICVIAVALVGFSMLTGHIAIRRGAQVILGCFVLLSAPVIALSLMGAWQSADQPATIPLAQAYDSLGPREELEQSTYNPYANDSLRRGVAE